MGKLAYARHMERDWYTQAPPDGSGIYIAGNIRAGWLVVGFYIPLDGELHLSDLSIVPGDMPPAETTNPSTVTRAGWLARGEYLTQTRSARTVAKTPPPRAVYARLLRMVPLGEMEEEVNAAARELVDFGRFLREHGASRRETGYVDTLTVAQDSLTPAKLEYLDAAHRFARLAKGLTKPIVALAAEMGISTQQLSDRLSSARKLGYLTSPGKGRKGGELTPLGEALVRRYLRQNKESDR